MTRKNYNFGERPTEFYNGKTLPTCLGPKYEVTKEAAIKLLESDYGKYLTESDFWIQKNVTKAGDKLMYSTLIITHDALMKINAALPDEKKFHQSYCSDPVPFEYGGKHGLLMYYRDDRDGMLEIGEITPDTCKNAYPYAMLLKRTFDRVVKRKAELFGIYSDCEEFPVEEPSIEADDIKKPKRATTNIPKEDVNLETGEIVEKDNVNSQVLLSIDDALNHYFEGLSKKEGQGLSISQLVHSDRLTSIEKEKRIELFLKKGSDRDKEACSIIQKAVALGDLEFKNSKE